MTSDRIQVWLGDRLVGHINKQPGTLFMVWVEVDGKPVSLKVKRRRASIDHFKLATSGPDHLARWIEENKIPDYAAEFREPMVDAIGYEWPVFNLDLDTYETVFDLAAFEPA
jgi:hypothetical protein